MEHDAIQISWSALPEQRMTFEVDGRLFEVEAIPPDWFRRRFGRRAPEGTGGPGCLSVSGLEPSTGYEILLSGPGFHRRRVAACRTLAAPPGRLMAKIATISDCHIGERRLGALQRLHDPTPLPVGLDPYPVRCARAAITESEEWGASMIVAKGDLTQEGETREIRDVVELLRGANVPVMVALGNHDVRGTADAAAELRDAGFIVADSAEYMDLPGLRIVLSHTPLPDRHAGRMRRDEVDAVATLAGSTKDPVLVVLHHPLRRWPVETHYPPSLRWRDSRRLAKGLARANGRSLVVAGHTHRNRRYRVGGVVVAEVGSTKDYPGQWAGYSVYEGGLRQVVRRVEHRDAVAWTEMTARAMGGLWGLWSPGRLEDRCWTFDR